jgi:hypothetical protein
MRWRNGYGRQRTGDGYYDHDFHPRKAGQTALVMHFHEETFYQIHSRAR